MAKVLESDAYALEAEQWKPYRGNVVPPVIEEDHHGENHAKSFHASGHGLQADRPKRPPATVSLPAHDAAKDNELHGPSVTIWSLTANLACSLKQVRV